MNRRSLLKGLLPATVALATGTAGATVVKRNEKCVLVVNRSMVSIQQAQDIGRSLDLPIGTMIIPVICAEDQTPESAFALLEREK